jgi:protein gp37
MAENTKTEWATHTFNPWIGCSPVHTGCKNCYAEAMAGRLGVTWGPNGTRRRTAASTWKQVETWNRQSQCRCPALVNEHGLQFQAELHLRDCPQSDRPRVFPSLCDPFEDWQKPIVDRWGQYAFRPTGGPVGEARPVTMTDLRRDFFALIDHCPNLDFLLLTKRPENVRRMWARRQNPVYEEPHHPDHRKNGWLLYSASDQSTLESGLPHLLPCRDLVPVLGLSLEPLIGPVDLRNASIDWVIVGGESGPNARPCDVEWIRSIVRQCAEANVPCFVKQLGARPVDAGHWRGTIPVEHYPPLDFNDPKGGDSSEWPEDLRVQEYPSGE